MGRLGSASMRGQAPATAGETAAWWAQAVAQAQPAGEVPLLLYRPDRGAWRAVWPLAVTLGLPAAGLLARLRVDGEHVTTPPEKHPWTGVFA